MYTLEGGACSCGAKLHLAMATMPRGPRLHDELQGVGRCALHEGQVLAVDRETEGFKLVRPVPRYRAPCIDVRLAIRLVNFSLSLP